MLLLVNTRRHVKELTTIFNGTRTVGTPNKGGGLRIFYSGLDYPLLLKKHTEQKTMLLLCNLLHKIRKEKVVVKRWNSLT